MFSGIVEEKAQVLRVEKKTGSCRIVVDSRIDHQETKIGDSIAVDGVCLTVVWKDSGELHFDVSQETLRKSTLADLQDGGKVNLERSLVVGGRVHGHFVFGHVDTTARLISRTEEGDSIKMTWSLPQEIRKYIAPKGSVALAGVSLTVGEVDLKVFSVYLIPHTLKATTLSDIKIGQKVNIEVDMLARYVDSALLADSGVDAGGRGISRQFLKEHGYLAEEE
jgi:riboflavin synthase